MVNDKLSGHLSIAAAYTIFGLNIVFCKDIANSEVVAPEVLFTLRAIGYLIVFATFFAYFLIPFGQKRIRPTLVSMYNYLQPIIAAIVSIAIGMDSLTWQKILATAFVVGGVVLVSRSRAAQNT